MYSSKNSISLQFSKLVIMFYSANGMLVSPRKRPQRATGRNINKKRRKKEDSRESSKNSKNSEGSRDRRQIF